MKKNSKYTLLLLCAALCLNGCQQPKGGTNESANGQDSVLVSTVVRHVSDTTGTYELRIEFPDGASTNGLLALAVDEWISEQLGGTYGDTINGDYSKLLADSAAVADHYFSETLKHNQSEFSEMLKYNPKAKEWEIRYYDSLSISKTDEAAGWITFSNVHETYTGGAHGSHTVYGQTFRKSDGRRIGWEILRNTYDEGFQKLLKSGLMECWELKKEEALEDILMGTANIYYIPLPLCPPMFTEDGICFLYNQYEIAPYAAGLPSFVVPYGDLQPYLLTTAKKLVGK